MGTPSRSCDALGKETALRFGIAGELGGPGLANTKFELGIFKGYRHQWNQPSPSWPTVIVIMQSSFKIFSVLLKKDLVAGMGRANHILPVFVFVLLTTYVFCLAVSSSLSSGVWNGLYFVDDLVLFHCLHLDGAAARWG